MIVMSTTTAWLILACLALAGCRSVSGIQIDTCESHYDSNFDLFGPQICPADRPYCCGTCANRTCCADPEKRLDQGDCSETCLAYFDYLHSFQSSLKCSSASPYCCGTCGGRFCCSTNFLRLNQTSCTQTCNSYTNMHGNYFPKERCPEEAPYCCGDCNNRYCCSNDAASLNQNSCSDKTLSTKSPSLASSSTHSFTEYMIIFIIFFVILTIISNYKINSRPPPQRRFSSNFYQRGNVPISITSHRVEAANANGPRPSSASSASSASTVTPANHLSSLNETQNGATNFNLFQCSYEDTPPAYESLKFDEPKEGANAAKQTTNDSSNA